MSKPRISTSLSAGGNPLYADPVIQGSVSFNWEHWYAFVWGSTDLKDRPGSSLGDEYDLGIGYLWKWNGWSFDLGATYFDEPHAGRVGRVGAEDILYIHAKASHDLRSGWTGSFGFESYVTLNGTDYNGGNLYSAGVSKVFKLGENISTPFSLDVVLDDGGFGYDKGLFLRGNLGLDYSLSPAVTLNFGARYYVPLSVDDARDDADAMAYVGVTWIPGKK